MPTITEAADVSRNVCASVELLNKATALERQGVMGLVLGKWFDLTLVTDFLWEKLELVDRFHDGLHDGTEDY